jgi:carboxypeptidase C (cathepsin A)
MRSRTSVLLLLLAALAMPARAQQPAAAVPAAAPRDTASRPAPVPKEESAVTEHTIRLGGVLVPYRATAATMILKNDKDEPIGSLYYTAYTRTDVKDPSQRPLAFVYNGGPGSASAWLHLGAFGPRRIVTTDAGPTPPPPYQLVDNAGSLIDVTDMVFIDPIGTGFSTLVGKGTGKDFWGVDEDARSLADFVRQYVTKTGRWTSPKYLIGESYGTTRSAVLVNRPQQREGMTFNGVVLISSVLDFETLQFAPGRDLSYVLYLPSYAATAAYHKVIPAPANLEAFLADVRRYATGEYAAALALGARLPAEQKSAVAKRLSQYTGLAEDYLLKADLRVNLRQFMAELQRSRGAITGRLDSRFSGPMMDLLSENAEGDPQSAAVTGAFTAATNTYLRGELKFPGEARYSMGGGTGDWNWAREGRRGWASSTYVGSDLVQAFVTNPQLRVEIENGYYDLATPFVATEFTVDHLPGLSASLRNNIVLKYYEAGHMMYLYEPALAKLKDNVARFITGTARANSGGPTTAGSNP